MIRLHTPPAVRSYRDTLQYQRSNRPHLDADGNPTGRQVWPLKLGK